MLQVIHDTLAAMGSSTEQVTVQVTEQVRRLLKAMGAKPISAKRLMILLRLRHRQNFTETYLNPALAGGLIAMTRPATNGIALISSRFTGTSWDSLDRTSQSADVVPAQSIVLPQRPLVCSRRQNHRTEAWWR